MPLAEVGRGVSKPFPGFRRQETHSGAALVVIKASAKSWTTASKERPWQWSPIS